MIPELSSRWRASQPPFDGTAVVSRNGIRIATLREMLVFLHSALRSTFPTVLGYTDWHEHDGFETSAVEVDWDFISETTGSTQALYESRAEDDSVRNALSPTSLEWLLRYNIDDEDERDHTTAWCDIDFSCSPSSNFAHLVTEFNSRWSQETEIVEAKRYYDAQFGG